MYVAEAALKRVRLCRAGRLLELLLLGVFASAVISLSGASGPSTLWMTLGLTLLAVFWVIVASMLLLCALHARFFSESLQSLRVLMLFCPALMAAGVSWVVASSEIFFASDHAHWFVLRNTLITIAFSLLYLRYLEFQQRWMQKVSAEATVRLDVLQARIRPHFLFNSLNTITSLIHDQPRLAEDATLDLADLLRSGLGSTDQHRIRSELDLIRRYLRLEKLRLGDRLAVDWQLDDELPLEQNLPPLLLQPLVENAIVHGIARRTEGGKLTIRGQRIRFARLRFIITNPLGDPDSRPAGGNQTALDNIRQRLSLAYEERYGLKTWVEDQQFKAELTIPVS